MAAREADSELQLHIAGDIERGIGQLPPGTAARADERALRTGILRAINDS